jgi:RNA polymerase sigma factor (TIGR02999 family)
MHDSSDLTQLLVRWSDGDEEALDELLPLLYDQLKEMAHGRLRGERPGHTLGTTALVHEAYVRLVDLDRIDWQDRSHFLAVASTTMRRILVDYARQRRAQKRGGSAEAVSLQEELIPDERVDLVLDLDDALEQLGAAHERQSKTLEMYYFGGLTLEEVGAALDISAATAMRDVRFAKTWLAREWRETPDIE